MSTVRKCLSRWKPAQAPITHLNDMLFSTLAEARSAITAWKEDYNRQRPHSALGNMTPAEFALDSSLEKQAA